MSAFKRICLGTAQFGLDYGISNNNGKILPCDVEKILKVASKYGVEWLDTAADYGTCEDTLSAYPKALREFKVTTKSLKYTHTHFPDFESVKTSFTNALHQSCKKLDRQSANIYYLRSPEQLFQTYGERVTDLIDNLKSQNLIHRIGISVYDKRQIEEILEYFTPDVIQLPCNLLDQRLISSGTLKHLKSQDIEIHARSIFLQGLILMNPNSSNFPTFFDPIKNHLNHFHAQCNEANIKPLEAALGFILSYKEIDRIILGTSSVTEWCETLQSIESAAQIDLDWTGFALDNETYLNPAQWSV